MNNKQVPEERPDIYKIEADLRDFFTKNKEGKGAGYALRVLKRLFDDGRNAPISASLPAEPLAPETKDKPATGSGGVLEERKKRVSELYEANRPKFHDWGTLKDMCIATAIQYADEYAPTGTVYVPVSVEEETAAKGNIPSLWIYVEQIGQYVKQVQFLPEREGVKCEHKYAVLLENGGGAMQCTDCGEVF